MRWDGAREEHWKSKLIEYNLEDCAALRRVTDFLRAVCTDAQISSRSFADAGHAFMPQAMLVQDLDNSAYSQKFGRPNFAHPDFEFVNDRAHFRYQQLRVYVRTNKPLKKRLSNSNIRLNQRLHVSQKLQICASKCPNPINA